MLTADEIRTTFCSMMVDGWVSDADEVSLPHLPGFRCIVSERGPWHCLDAYCVGEDERSWGFTTLSHKGFVVLTMSYGGMYERRALRPLKTILYRTYSMREFVGGRGGVYDAANGVHYINHCEDLGGRFSGMEEMYGLGDDHKLRPLGYHRYSGMIFEEK